MEKQAGIAQHHGSGSDTVAQLIVAFSALSYGEHGQVPHLALRAGIVRVLIFAFAMLAVIRKKWWTPTQAMGFSLLFVAPTQFATEPAWELELRTMSCALMMLTAGLLATKSPEPVEQPKKSRPAAK